MSTKGIIRQELEEARSVLEQFITDENISRIEQAGIKMVDALKLGGTIFSCGNGGSMSDSMHFAEELTGRFRNNRKALRAISISDPSHLSCVANDYGFKFVFSRFIEAHGRKGDVLLAISTSGNSENILEAVQAAKSLGMTIISLTGKDGGKLAGLSDVEVRSPKSQYSDRIQEIHIKVIHSLIHFIESNL